MAVRTKQPVRQRNAERDPYDYGYDDRFVSDPAPARPPIKSGKSKKSKKSKKRQKSPMWAKIMVTLGALLMIASGAVVVIADRLFSQIENSIQTVSVLDGETGKQEPKSGGKAMSGAIDLLLLGLDTRTAEDFEKGNMRADTVILMHIPATHDQAYLMSIPRDAKVAIPGHRDDKINAAFFFGAQNGKTPKERVKNGMKLMVSTVKQLTGISFDGVAVIDFQGFKKVVDAIGSVNMCVDGETKSLHYYWGVPGAGTQRPTYVNEHTAEKKGYKPYIHKKGCREMAGWEALDYSRVRKGVSDGSGDYARQRHQQQLIKAIAKKATSAGIVTDLGKVNQLISAVGQSLFLDTGGVGLIDFIFTLKDLAGADMVLLKTNGGWFTGGEGGEQLDAGTMAMFAAAKSDKLGQFVLENPDFINKEK